MSTNTHTSTGGTAPAPAPFTLPSKRDFATDAEWNKFIVDKIRALEPCPPTGNHDTTLELVHMGRKEFYALR
ncbi:MAG: hypothetical protein LBR07_05710 [Puniceicoccales bacterium]|jgi:hypothetical protein|nr:hypothetical protein [Puniceicoccales bacterium]